MREIVGRMRLEEMVSDRQKFADLVKENAEPDLLPWVWTLSASMCRTLRIPMVSLMTLVSTTFPRSKKAAIAKAEAEKEIAVAKAEADRQSNDARINSERDRHQEQRAGYAEGRASEKNADSKRAEADAAYEIQKEEQRKTIEVTAANANIAKRGTSGALKTA